MLRLWHAHLSDLPADFALRLPGSIQRVMRRCHRGHCLLVSCAAREGSICLVLEIVQVPSEHGYGASGSAAEVAGPEHAASQFRTAQFAESLVTQVLKDLQLQSETPCPHNFTASVQVGPPGSSPVSWPFRPDGG